MQCGSLASSSQLSPSSLSSYCSGCMEAYGGNLSEAGIREPELTLQVLSSLGGVKSFPASRRLDFGLDRWRAVSRLLLA
jgi:hypothetical protein